MVTAGVVCISLAVIDRVQAATLTPAFSSFYSLIDLGTIPKLPPTYGGLTFQSGNPNQLLIGGLADTPNSGIYSVNVKRDSDNHITSFGNASFVSTAPGSLGIGGIDAGLTNSPLGDVLFYTAYPDNSIGQIQPGSSSPNKQITLDSLGIPSSTGALAFVPDGFAGAGRLKITSYTANTFYDTIITPDGLGTYNIAAPTKGTQLDGGLDSFVYIKAGNPGFTADSLLITEFDSQNVSAYEIDGNGDPIASTRRDFLTGITSHTPTTLVGTIGTTVDPLTGDVFFSTFFEDDPEQSKIFQLRGFTPQLSCSN
jgi:hypothetical protein